MTLDFNTLPLAVSEMLERLESIEHNIQSIKSLQEEKINKRFISPEETRNMFSPKVSLVTLNSWAEKRFLNKHYIGGRTYYLYSEVIDAVKTLKKYSRTK